VIYVIEGTATFITGGKAIDPKEVAPNEIRGRAIEGGEAHQITQGDVVVVPAGVPHWFKEVRGPFLYFVCKPIAAPDSLVSAR
jgi:mannose-6-phosphate isomerase-like protein (cupin superfamily)